MPTASQQRPAVHRRPGNGKRPARPAPTRREVTITVPFGRAADALSVPVVTASRVLSAAGGAPFYAGLGILAVTDVISWPIAVTAGAGYLALRRWGPLQRPSAPPSDVKGR
jgi:hypothetical protein